MIPESDFIISTDKSIIDITVVHHYLSKESYWSKNIPVDIVAKSIEGACCFGVYQKQNNNSIKQVGFARVITDNATFGYLADVFILPEYQGMGLGKKLMQAIMQHPQLQGFRAWMLATKDAHSLYEKFGFKRMQHSERIMRLSMFEAYPEIPAAE